jgi:phosphopantothenoylcysteine decarboxylase/phosphopantothenate--cysteine ligase
MAAAVADFAPVAPSAGKIKRDRIKDGRLTIELSPNPDILRDAGLRKQHQILVGFALETDDAAVNARRKVREKNLDLIVLNNPTEEGAGFGTDTNIVSLLYADGRTEQLPKMAKIDVAHEILNRVGPLLVRTNRA